MLTKARNALCDYLALLYSYLGPWIYQVEIDKTFAKLLDDALIRLAAGMGVDEERSLNSMAKSERKGAAESLTRKDQSDMIPNYRILMFVFGPFLW